tara:strand:+ start:87 stop:341 length:255 start_codon:yes stop_codon:yes gene_type:complete
MGTYQKMKRAKNVVEFLDFNYQNTKNDPELSSDSELLEIKLQHLESAREKYRTLKYEYTIQSSVLVLIVFAALAVITSILFGGV